ncbi:MAG: hypothetical protein J6Q57_04015 [Paraprevotella sp.]|nr:hypothetical protein [Paraprevotella sp.]
MKKTIKQEMTHDELTCRIVQRLAERQRKVKQMEEWEHHAGTSTKRFVMTVMSVAACVTLLWLLIPSNSVSVVDELGIRPDMTEFRSALPELSAIQQMLDASEYEKALIVVQKILNQSDSTLQVLKSEDIPLEEDVEYEMHFERVMNSELRWLYIYLLTKSERYDIVLTQLELYMKDESNAPHIATAKALYETIKEKNKK